ERIELLEVLRQHGDGGHAVERAVRRGPTPGENKERRTETCQPRRENIADIGTDIAGHVHVEEASLARVKRSEERRVGKEGWPRDWSSDVCSSDLERIELLEVLRQHGDGGHAVERAVRRGPTPGENKERRTETCQPRRENIADIGTDIAGHVHVEEASLARVK